MKGRVCLIGFVTIAAWWMGSMTTYAQKLKRDLQDSRVDKRWIYNDWEAAKAVATKNNKPIFALFR